MRSTICLSIVWLEDTYKMFIKYSKMARKRSNLLETLTGCSKNDQNAQNTHRVKDMIKIIEVLTGCSKCSYYSQDAQKIQHLQEMINILNILVLAVLTGAQKMLKKCIL